MKKISFTAILEQEADACEKSAMNNPSPLSEAFTALGISYRSISRRLRAEAGFKEKQNASKDS